MVRSVKVKKPGNSLLLGFLRKIARWEVIGGIVALLTGFGTLFYQFSQKNEILATVIPGTGYVDGESISLPIGIQVQNMGDGPVAVNYVLIAYPSSIPPSENCEYPSDSVKSHFESVVTIDPQKRELFNLEFSVPKGRLPTEVCLQVTWRNQNGYQRTYLESVGRYEGYVSSAKDGGTPKILMNGGVMDQFPIFHSQSCVLLFKNEFCI